MPDPLNTPPDQAPGEQTPRFIYRPPQPRDGGTAVMIAAGALIALAVLDLVFSNLPS